MAVKFLDSLPLGYRFRPTDAELVDHYLRLKINGDEKNSRVIREIEVCKHEPWDLPDLSAMPTKDQEWFFFCPRDIKYPNGSRLNRATRAGYWKATGKDRKITSNVTSIGMKKTLVFYSGRAPKGKRTRWVMHEYRTMLDELDGTHPGQRAFVLCRLFHKQDKTVEDSNLDATELDDSPTGVKSSPTDTELELEMRQDIPSTALLVRPSVKHDTKHQAIGLPANEVNLQHGIDSTFDYPLMYPLPLPLPLQIKEGMGPSDHDQFKCSGISLAQGPDDNVDEVTVFIDSILTDGNDGKYSEQFDVRDCSLADEGLLPMFGTEFNQGVDHECSEAKLKENVPPEQMDRNLGSMVLDISEEAPCPPYLDQQHRIHVLQSSAHPATAANSESHLETGIRIRHRPKVEVTSPNMAVQGDAARRLRVERRLQIGQTIHRVYPGDPEQSNEDRKSKTLDAEETKAIEKATTNGNEEASSEDTRSSSLTKEEEWRIVASEEAQLKDDACCSINRRGVWSSSSVYTFLSPRKALLPLCSSINLLRLSTLLALSLCLITALFWSSSSYSLY